MAKTKNMPVAVPYQVRMQDCCAGLRSLIRPPMLIICDPPYNQGADYADYDDTKPEAKYWAWTQRWLAASYHALHPNGSFWIFAPDEWVSETDLFCRQKLGLHRRNHNVWAFTFGQAAKNRFTRSHVHLLYFSRHKTKFTFNADAMRVPSARQLVYNDKRAVKGGKMPDDTWCLLKSDLETALRADGDVWLENRICGTYKEREKHSPNQIPTAVTDRIVAACSNIGELVMDPFLGAGGTGVSAVRLGRRFIGCDISQTCVDASEKRIAAAVQELEDKEKNRGDHVQMPLFKPKE